MSRNMKNKKIYGGWHGTETLKDGFERPVKTTVVCQAPDRAIYRENLKARRTAR